MSKVSPQQIALLEAGAFPEQIDPWAEQGHYFHQLHGHIITYLFDQLRKSVFEQGYLIGREASIQILQTQPDIFVRSQNPPMPTNRNYADAAATLSLESGIAFSTVDVPEIDALFIKSQDTGRTVTIVEIISPSNKSQASNIEKYQARRQSLLENGVDIVEIDLCRSVQHLINDELASQFPYHIAIHLHDELPRFIGIRLNEALKPFALPIEEHVIPVDLNVVYRHAYAQLLITSQIYHDKHYNEEYLPFPSLLSEEERRRLFKQLEDWKAKLV